MGFISEHSLLILLSISGVLSFFYFFLCRKKLKLSVPVLTVITAIMMIWGFAAARWVFPFIEAFGNIHKMANLRMYGIFYFDCIGIWILTKVLKTNDQLLFDISAIGVVTAAVLGRLDCFFKGCCYGVSFFDTRFRWPIREIELVANLLFLAFYIPKVYGGKTHGQVYPIALIYYGIVRFILECFRVEGTLIGNKGFHLAHVWSIVSILMGLIWVLFLYEKQKKVQTRIQGRKKH